MSIFTTKEEREKMGEIAHNGPTFEDFSNQNGITFWWATDFMVMIGYSSMPAFIKPLNRAMQACLSIDIDCHDNFIKADRLVDGEKVSDYKLTRFACYMIAMNGDIKKPEVAAAQAYFAKQAENIDLILEGSNDVERVLLRSEVKDGNKALTSAAKASGVTNYALFMDAGYRGLYNMGLSKVKQRKGVNGELYDYMGKAELSANWFRATMTEERLKSEKIKNEKLASNIHKTVGADVRNLVKKNTGMFPEQLPIERKLGEISRELKKANKKLNNKS